MLKKISPNLKTFLISFLLSLPFWWGLNVFEKSLEDFLFWREVTNNPQVFLGQIVPEKKLITAKPVRNWQIDNLKIDGTSAISVLIDPQGNRSILFDKDTDEKLPIASLTKLMTAYVIWENYDLSQLIEISRKAVKEEGSSGDFKIGESLTIKSLLYSLLIESSNDAATALTELIGEEPFVDLMNLEAKTLGMENTYFFNSTGLEPDNPNSPVNYSSTKDLVKLTTYLLKTNPKILEISALPEYDLYSPNGTFHHKLKNTNELLTEFPGIIGSKTGWTPQAQGCLILVTKVPENRGVIVNVVLGSSNRFEEMRKLINWIGKAYQW